MSVTILVDADACPVKDEVYRVAWRHEVPVKIVSNSRLRVPDHPLIERVVVSDGFDAADDWIAEAANARSIAGFATDLSSLPTNRRRCWLHIWPVAQWIIPAALSRPISKSRA